MEFAGTARRRGCGGMLTADEQFKHAATVFGQEGPG
jgi:hypothetical protein